MAPSAVHAPHRRLSWTTEEIFIARGFRRESTTEDMMRCRNFRRQSTTQQVITRVSPNLSLKIFTCYINIINWMELM